MPNRNIKIGSRRFHSKASEEYVSVEFTYGEQVVRWDLPIEYRRTGTHLSDSSENQIAEYIEKVYETCRPETWKQFRLDQATFWKGRKADTTKGFFDVLISDFNWKSTESDLPANRNFARRIQDLKEFGYTIATDTSRIDKRTGRQATHLLLLPLPRGGITGYETWTKATREKIVSVLKNYDAYEGRPGKPESLLPDHKFPEIRWDSDVKRDDLSKLTSSEIIEDFQLLTNQRNLQKREACRKCSQTGERGTPFGVIYFYKGSRNWDMKIPIRGQEARKGCVGCGWYDLQAWRESLNAKVSDG